MYGFCYYKLHNHFLISSICLTERYSLGCSHIIDHCSIIMFNHDKVSNEKSFFLKKKKSKALHFLIKIFHFSAYV